MIKLFFIATVFFPIVCFSQIIQLNNGDSLNVIIKMQTKESLIVEHTSLGELTIEKGKIANLQSIDLQALAQVENEQSTEIKVVDEGFFGTGLLVDWDRSIDVGINGASGASNNTSFRSAVNTYYEDDEDRWDFKSVYIYKQDDHETTDNQFKTDLLKDWFLKDSPWFYFAHVGFDWDQFKDWDYRGRLGTGPGYTFVKNKQLELAARAGLSAVYEVMEPEDDVNLEGLMGLHIKWNISELQSLRFDNILYPSITDAGEYRNVTIFEWTHKLNYYKGLAIKLGFQNEYDTTQTDKNDLKYHAAIAWGL
ncbi:MAG: YdiY family protein [Methylococcaceae bacterium]